MQTKDDARNLRVGGMTEQGDNVWLQHTEEEGEDLRMKGYIVYPEKNLLNDPFITNPCLIKITNIERSR